MLNVCSPDATLPSNGVAPSVLPSKRIWAPAGDVTTDSRVRFSERRSSWMRWSSCARCVSGIAAPPSCNERS
jgi:hypothetical protein